MRTIVVTNEPAEEPTIEALVSTLSRRVETTAIAPTRFLREAGVSLHRESGLLVQERQSFTAVFPDVADVLVVNRVVEVTDDEANDLGEGSGLIPRGLAFSQLATTLGEFPNVLGTPGKNSPVGDLLPLPLQWHAIDSQVQGVETPRFVYAVGAVEVDTSTFAQPVWKSPLDWYVWAVNERPQTPVVNPFVVDRPRGRGFVTYFVGEALDVFAMDDKPVPPRLRERLLEVTPRIKTVFRAFLGETLFFADGDRVVFASFSHYLKTAATTCGFGKVLESGLGSFLN